MLVCTFSEHGLFLERDSYFVGAKNYTVPALLGRFYFVEQGFVNWRRSVCGVVGSGGIRLLLGRTGGWDLFCKNVIFQSRAGRPGRSGSLWFLKF